MDNWLFWEKVLINYELKITNYELDVDVSDLAQGVYYVRIISGKIQKMVRITIVR